jgi:DNA polymerase sigma
MNQPITPRLPPRIIDTIVTLFERIFTKGELYLFGSRADNAQKGGDIDLFIVPDSLQDITAKKISFLVALKRSIGEQKIDVVIDRGQDRPIDQIAKQQGVLLCQKH